MGKAAGTAGAFWYVAAAVTYCGIAIFEKSLLNWFVGPLWLVAFVWIGPLVAERLGIGRSHPEREDDDEELDGTPVGQPE